MAPFNSSEISASYSQVSHKSLRTKNSKISLADNPNKGNFKNEYRNFGFNGIERSRNSNVEYVKSEEIGDKRFKDSRTEKKNDDISSPLLKFIFEQARAFESLNSKPYSESRVYVNQPFTPMRRRRNKGYKNHANNHVKNGSQRTTNQCTNLVSREHGRNGKSKLLDQLVNEKNEPDTSRPKPDLELKHGASLDSDTLLCRKIEEAIYKLLGIIPRTKNGGDNYYQLFNDSGADKKHEISAPLLKFIFGVQDGLQFSTPDRSNEFNTYQRADDQGIENCNSKQFASSLHHRGDEYGLYHPFPEPEGKYSQYSSPLSNSGLWNSVWGNSYSDPLLTCANCDATNQRLRMSNDAELMNQLPNLTPDHQQAYSLTGVESDDDQLADLLGLQFYRDLSQCTDPVPDLQSECSIWNFTDSFCDRKYGYGTTPRLDSCVSQSVEEESEICNSLLKNLRMPLNFEEASTDSLFSLPVCDNGGVDQISTSQPR